MRKQLVFKIFHNTTLSNTIINISAAATVKLPPVKDGMDIIVNATASQTIKVDPDDSDQIRLQGAYLTAGNEIDSAAGIGNAVQLITEDADGFLAIEINGSWSDGGSS